MKDLPLNPPDLDEEEPDCETCGGEGTISEDRWCWKTDGHYTRDYACPECNEPDEPDWDAMADQLKLDGGYDYDR